MKLGIVGCGKIASYHLHSMRKAGFKLYSISGTNNSKNAKILKKKFNIPKIFNDSKDHIDSKIYDALLFLTPPEITYEYLKNIDQSVKILTEKPVSFYSSKLKKLIKNKNIKVAFNRRQYESVNKIKLEIIKGNIFDLDFSIPENIDFSLKNHKFRKKYFNVFYNSIHIFDLIKYLVGSYDVISTKYIKDKFNQFRGYIIKIKSKKVRNITVKSIFNSSNNFSIDAYSDKIRFQLSPIECFIAFKGLKIIEPKPDYPLRRYKPITIKSSFEFVKKNSKPGFNQQAKEFYKFCKKKQTNLATITDMIDSIRLAERIFESKNKSK